MAADNVFDGKKKLRTAEILNIPNFLKQKVGDGGLSETFIARAEEAVESVQVDFRPVASELLTVLNFAILKAEKGVVTGEDAIEEILSPAVQLKAQGGMFKYPLISDISEILINFLETVETLDRDAFDIITAHKKALTAVVGNDLKGTTPPHADALKTSLTEACARYYRSRAN